MKTALCGLALALSLVWMSVAQTPATPKYHVIFQLSEPQGDAAWDAVFPHVTNLQNALGKENVEVEVVFFGPGINMLTKKDGKHEANLKLLAEKGVKIAACQNAMKFFKLTGEDLYPFATQVDAGVAELTRKQAAGWQYIH
jgi:intracellular sulfur oxidation DsrE/DsrF family protein